MIIIINSLFDVGLRSSIKNGGSFSWSTQIGQPWEIRITSQKLTWRNIETFIQEKSLSERWIVTDLGL